MFQRELWEFSHFHMYRAFVLTHAQSLCTHSCTEPLYSLIHRTFRLKPPSVVHPLLRRSQASSWLRRYMHDFPFRSRDTIINEWVWCEIGPRQIIRWLYFMTVLVIIHDLGSSITWHLWLYPMTLMVVSHDLHGCITWPWWLSYMTLVVILHDLGGSIACAEVFWHSRFQSPSVSTSDLSLVPSTRNHLFLTWSG